MGEGMIQEVIPAPEYIKGVEKEEEIKEVIEKMHKYCKRNVKKIEELTEGQYSVKIIMNFEKR